jgi:hypothetical protein
LSSKTLFLNWLRARVGKSVFCLVPRLAAFGGAPVRPEEIEELSSCMNQAEVAYTLPQEHDRDDPIEELLGLERQ